MLYTLSRAAEADIVELYIEGVLLFGMAQADAYLSSLEDCFVFLADHPRAARERVEISPPVRCHPHRRHLVVYTLGSEDRVLILRVRHGREDWDGRAG